MDALHLKTGYLVQLKTCKDTESAESADSAEPVTVTVIATTGVPEMGCTLSHDASFALQRNGHMPECVKIVAVLAGPAMCREFGESRARLDQAVIDATMLTHSHLQVSATFWIMVVRMCTWPSTTVLPVIILGLALGLASQAWWASRRIRYVSRLAKYQRVQRHWETMNPNGKDALDSQSSEALAMECETMTDVNKWAGEVSAFRASVWSLFVK